MHLAYRDPTADRPTFYFVVCGGNALKVRSTIEPALAEHFTNI